MATGRILVVDDEATIRFFLEETLTRDGHEVVAVESGEAALELGASQENAFDLALIDLKLTGVGGMEVMASLRRHSPDMSIIVLTGHGSMETAVKALRQGAHDYLFKPCKTVQLRESVRTGLLKRRRELRQHRLLNQLEQNLTSSLEDIRATVVESFAPPHSLSTESADEQESRFLQRGNLIVDFMRHVITLDGHLLELSPTEFDLMAYLVSEAPRVISSQEMVREVQGYESELWEARGIVRGHIYRIRQKIKTATGRTGIVRTARGVGYMISE